MHRNDHWQQKWNVSKTFTFKTYFFAFYFLWTERIWCCGSRLLQRCIFLLRHFGFYHAHDFYLQSKTFFSSSLTLMVFWMSRDIPFSYTLPPLTSLLTIVSIIIIMTVIVTMLSRTMTYQYRQNYNWQMVLILIMAKMMTIIEFVEVYRNYF